MDDAGLIHMLDRYGLPLVVLAVVAYSLMRVLKWAGPRIDQIVASHISTLEKVALTQHEIAHTQEMLKSLVVALATNEQQFRDTLDKIRGSVEWLVGWHQDCGTEEKASGRG